MIVLLNRLRAVRAAELRLIAEALIALAIAALLVALLPFRRIAAFAGRPLARRPAAGVNEAEAIAQIRWAVGACARRVPWRAKCFEQGLAAQGMLRRRSIPATLHYGVGKRADEGLVAHVWVRAGPSDVIGCENSADFSEMARFPA